MEQEGQKKFWARPELSSSSLRSCEHVSLVDSPLPSYDLISSTRMRYWEQAKAGSFALHRRQSPSCDTYFLPVAAPSRTHSGMNFQVVPKGRSDSSWIESRGVRLSPLQPSQGLLCPGMAGQSRKTAARGWRNDMVVESTCCPSRESKFSFQHPQQAVQNCLWLQIQGIQHPLLTCMDSVQTYT